MKRRLQELWDEVVPLDGPSPQPDPKAVLRRMKLEEKPRKGRRGVKLMVILAAVLLFTGAAVAANSGFPEHNVLRSFFYRGEIDTYSESLVNTTPLSVSDENYTVILTSSIADKNKVFCTVEVWPKTQRGWDYLQQHGIAEESKLTIKPSWALWREIWASIDDKGDHFEIDFDDLLGFGIRRSISFRLNDMEDGLCLKIPVRPISDKTIKINASGQGMGSRECGMGGPVTLKKVVLSPLSVYMDYTTTRHEEGYPVLFYLWKDGTITTMGQTQMIGPSGESVNNNEELRCRYSWQFFSVQDLTKMEAVIFEDMAYPLDGGKPYPVDTSDLPHPFTLPLGPQYPLKDYEKGYYYCIPLFAFCEGLNVPCDWNEETRTASMTFRGLTVTVQEGSDKAVLSGVNNEMLEMGNPAEFRDGDLWVDLYEGLWNMNSLRAYRDYLTELDETESGLLRDIEWSLRVVIP